MADITMCLTKECRLKDKCYRYTAPRDPWRQSMQKFKDDTDENPCKSYWNNKDRR